jgi:ribA/ribD-fused uncharacterized protein
LDHIPDELRRHWEKVIVEHRRELLQVKPEERIIRFYETNKPYGCFSNFARYPLEIVGKLWPTSEHYFQAMKFAGTEYEEFIRSAPTAMEAAKMGRDRTWPLRRDWEECKVSIMKEAVRAKVEQHDEVKQILMSTGNCILVEHTSIDSFWGDNGDGTGRNMLGQLLMEVRNEQESYSPEFFLPQWMVYPEHNPYSMFWRMGTGETYIMYLWEWRKGLSKEALREYDAYFVPPADWKRDRE